MPQEKRLFLECSKDFPDSRAAKLAKEFGALRLAEGWESNPETQALRDNPSSGAFLLSLQKSAPHRLSSLSDSKLSLEVDFLGGEFRHRLKTSGKQQPLAKAVGLAKGVTQILDLTGGLGGDAVVLASLGAQITMIERHPVLAFLVEEAANRASIELPFLKDRLKILCAEALDFLEQTQESFEAIYYDPMYPIMDKSALPRKEMQLLKELLGRDSVETEAKIVQSALARATRRVAVKRPQGAPVILPNPGLTIDGSTTRFDIYLK